MSTDKTNRADKASDDLLSSLHNAVAEALLAKVRSGEASAADLAAAAKFLKDNGITAVLAPDTPMGNLTEELDLPFSDDGDE
jgi:ABC-type Zn uptake system ZnuABC Zn-binding protein ZnuA